MHSASMPPCSIAQPRRRLLQLQSEDALQGLQRAFQGFEALTRACNRPRRASFSMSAAATDTLSDSTMPTWTPPEESACYIQIETDDDPNILTDRKEDRVKSRQTCQVDPVKCSQSFGSPWG